MDLYFFAYGILKQDTYYERKKINEEFKLDL